MSALHLKAPAKINLFLNITGRRPDGYHELQTVFQLLDYCDDVFFDLADVLTLECEGVDVPVEQNLVYRAAIGLQQATGCRQGAKLRVEKRIPDGGGLGGGSSDAATTLIGLNRLWGLGLGTDELAAIGLSLGADVPVFVRGRSAWAEGVGEELEPVDLPGQWYVVVHPGVAVSTPEIFGHPDLTRNGTPITIARFLRQGAGNACETVVRRLYPAVDEAARWLARFGPAQMTGTGACVFVPAETEQQASEIASAVPPPWSGFAARAINVSPAIGSVS